MHKFNPVNKSKLDNEWRREALPPTKVLECLGLEQNDTVADIGCGIGYFTIPAAELVEQNKVYALDISEEMLAEVERRAQISDIKNIVTVQTQEYNFKLPDMGVSFGLIVNVIHEIDDKERMLAEASRMLKIGGKLAIVEWEKTETEYGPPFDHRISREEVKRLLNIAGFEILREQDFNGIFYGITAQKKQHSNVGYLESSQSLFSGYQI